MSDSASDKLIAFKETVVTYNELISLLDPDTEKKTIDAYNEVIKTYKELIELYEPPAPAPKTTEEIEKDIKKILEENQGMIDQCGFAK